MTTEKEKELLQKDIKDLKTQNDRLSLILFFWMVWEDIFFEYWIDNIEGFDIKEHDIIKKWYNEMKNAFINETKDKGIIW